MRAPATTAWTGRRARHRTAHGRGRVFWHGEDRRGRLRRHPLREQRVGEAEVRDAGPGRSHERGRPPGHGGQGQGRWDRGRRGRARRRRDARRGDRRAGRRRRGGDRTGLHDHAANLAADRLVDPLAGMRVPCTQDTAPAPLQPLRTPLSPPSGVRRPPGQPRSGGADPDYYKTKYGTARFRICGPGRIRRSQPENGLPLRCALPSQGSALTARIVASTPPSARAAPGRC